MSKKNLSFCLWILCVFLSKDFIRIEELKD